MIDLSHLDALKTRLSHEREYLAATKTERLRALRKVWIAQIEREIEQEMAFLGIGPVDPEITAMDDESLLIALGA